MGRKKAAPPRETTQERHERIATEAENLLAGGMWPEHVAQKLNYAAAGNLSTVLKKWGYVKLGERFDKVNFDGLTPPAQRTAYQKRRGAAA